MKKLFAPLTAAAALAFGPAAFAQTTEAEPSPAEVVEAVCSKMAADPVNPAPCTNEQRRRALAHLTEIAARPAPTDSYQLMRRMYDLFEGLRQIFAPNDPPMPLPPRDRFDVDGYQLCAAIQERVGQICTLEQRDALRALTQRLSESPAPTTPAENAARSAEINRELDRIFPNIPRAVPSDGSSPPDL